MPELVWIVDPAIGEVVVEGILRRLRQSQGIIRLAETYGAVRLSTGSATTMTRIQACWSPQY